MLIRQVLKSIMQSLKERRRQSSSGLLRKESSVTFVIRNEEFRVVLPQPQSSENLTNKKDLTILDLASRNSILIESSCEGSGTCGTCRVELLEEPSPKSERNEIELEFAEERDFRPNERLSCQLVARPGMRVRVFC